MIILEVVDPRFTLPHVVKSPMTNFNPFVWSPFNLLSFSDRAAPPVRVVEFLRRC